MGLVKHNYLLLQMFNGSQNLEANEKFILFHPQSLKEHFLFFLVCFGTPSPPILSHLPHQSFIILSSPPPVTIFSFFQPHFLHHQ